ncbi:hypothetical protein JOC85_002827 [Bacillus mesophilus]|uniref:2-oxoglutarate dehydrogenase E1 n=1 Tax=Bacillus mesophilus TaxID=1808955 RepID=A0A6M0Q8L4_9BACI|nr:2-oxoglutarate dehydrogenase E1 [Bacillus mesophilus]MBM7662020.1 hypothetical protein [Bacillus mesophilus]NEY72623.1 2-oxoglutarate dehydrogenase E1 [Bacillus mesophilus]
MKVLSMIQPWASLFALQLAQYETRTWKTNYRGTLAIHTSKKINKEVCSHIAIQKLLGKKGYTVDKLPTGQIIAICKLVNCLQIVEHDQTSAILEDGRVVAGNDFLLGEFITGNYAWVVHDMKLLDVYIPAKGKLGLWEYPL